MIRSHFPENADIAIAVAKSESGKLLSVRAYNPEWHYDRQGNKVCQGSFGVFQIACVHVENTEQLFDPEFNLTKAREIYLEQGWQPWGGYTSGGYKAHLAML